MTKKKTSNRAEMQERRRRLLTLSEIRAIRRKGSMDSMGNEKRLADSFTLEGADDREKAFLTICRAVYRRSADAFCDDNTPAEKLIGQLLFHISYWPLTVEDVKTALADVEGSWKQREEGAQLLRQEAEETKTLLKQCGERRVDCEEPENEAITRIQ